MKAYRYLIILLCIVLLFVYKNTTQDEFVHEAEHDALADFILQDVNNQTHRLADYQGKWVVVNFWATWCGPCIHEIPQLERFYRAQRDNNIMVIGINFEKLSSEQLRQAIAEFNISYLVLKAGDEPLTPFEPLQGLPSTFVVSPQGRLVKSWLGPVDEAMLQFYFSAVLEGARGRRNGVDTKYLITRM